MLRRFDFSRKTEAGELEARETGNEHARDHGKEKGERPFPLPLVLCARSCSSKKRETSGNEAGSVMYNDIGNGQRAPLPPPVRFLPREFCPYQRTATREILSPVNTSTIISLASSFGSSSAVVLVTLNGVKSINSLASAS